VLLRTTRNRSASPASPPSSSTAVCSCSVRTAGSLRAGLSAAGVCRLGQSHDYRVGAMWRLLLCSSRANSVDQCRSRRRASVVVDGRQTRRRRAYEGIQVRHKTRRGRRRSRRSVLPQGRAPARSPPLSAHRLRPRRRAIPRTSADRCTGLPRSSASSRPTVAVTEQNDSAARSRASGRRSLSVFCACFGFCEPFIEVLSLQSCRRRRCRRRHSGTDHRRPRRGR